MMHYYEQTVEIWIKKQQQITVLREHIDFHFERKMLKIFSTSIVKQFAPCPELL